MRTAHLSSAMRGGSLGPDGFGLVVEDVPWWALGVDWAYNMLLRLLLHPCCSTRDCGKDCGYKDTFDCDTGKKHPRTPMGWFRDHLPGEWLQDRVSIFQWWLINNWISNFSWRRTNQVISVPLTVAQATTMSPTWVQAHEAMHDEIEKGL